MPALLGGVQATGDGEQRREPCQGHERGYDQGSRRARSLECDAAHENGRADHHKDHAPGQRAHPEGHRAGQKDQEPQQRAAGLAESSHGLISMAWKERMLLDPDSRDPRSARRDLLTLVSGQVSHNLDLGALVDRLGTPACVLRGKVNGFLRLADQLITLLGKDQSLSHQNVLGARAVGVKASLGWSSPGEHLAIDGKLTWQDLRNQSDEGVFGELAGERVPHRPWLMANGSARLRLQSLATAGDELVFTWVARYVHELFRSWESAGAQGHQADRPSAAHPYRGSVVSGAAPCARRHLDHRNARPHQRPYLRPPRRAATGPCGLCQDDRRISKCCSGLDSGKVGGREIRAPLAAGETMPHAAMRGYARKTHQGAADVPVFGEKYLCPGFRPCRMIFPLCLLDNGQDRLVTAYLSFIPRDQSAPGTHLIRDGLRALTAMSC